MTVYKPRSAWTSTARGGAQLTGSKLVGIAWHWPGTSQDEIGAETEAQTANRLRGYRNFHVNTRGWSDIGYNMAIDQAGRVWELRGLGRVGAHAASPSNPDANHEWMGVLLILGDRERPSAQMVRACQDFTHDVFLPRWPGRRRDTGHGRAPGVPGAQTSCPGPFAAELIVDGELIQEPDQEDDDMPLTDEDVARVADKMLERLRNPQVVSNPGGPDRSVTHALSLAMRGTLGNADTLAKVLANQQAIMAAQGVDVDEQALATQLAAVLVPAVLAALPDTGLTAEQVEEAAARAVENVLRRGVDA